MIAELGHFALLLALCVSLVQGGLSLYGAARRPALTAVARPAALVQLLLMLLALGALAWGFGQNDLSLRYVAEHSDASLPLPYRLAAVWGGHEGSLLLWATLLTAWGGAVALLGREWPRLFQARVLGVMGLLSAGFLLFLLATSNPFLRLLPPPVAGADLNPMLQDPALALHPPALYMGYVGFAVAYAFAVAALLEGRIDGVWARRLRPWVVMAWVWLTAGIALGSWWAYYELGWGGWWFWDPVENASLVPWLVGTALLHALAITERRGLFPAASLLLAVVAFGLSLLGTFLVRSGVLTSVHAFATDPERGLFMLLFLGIALGAPLALFAWRGPAPVSAPLRWLSREALLLAANLLLLVAAGTVLLGTLYPLALEALDLGKVSVGVPYFEAVFVPVAAPLLLLMGLAPILPWRGTPGGMLLRRLAWPGVGAVAATLLVVMVAGGTVRAGVGVFLGSWVGIAAGAGLLRHLRSRRLPLRQAAMAAAHGGIALCVLGMTLSGGYGREAQLTLAPGSEAQLAGYLFRFDGVREVAGPNYAAIEGEIAVAREGDVEALLHPQKRSYGVEGRVMTEAAIDAGLTRHLYVALGEPAEEGGWGMRLYYKPFIGWIWLGAALMAGGGLLAVIARRRPGRAA